MFLEVLSARCTELRHLSLISPMLFLIALEATSVANASMPTLSSQEFLQVYAGRESQETASKLSSILGYVAKRNLVPPIEVGFPNVKSPRVEARALSFSAFNLEQGRRMDEILADIQRSMKTQTFRRQSDFIWGSDFLIINEADWGTCRSRFRNVTDDLSKVLGYDSVFGTEFLEVQPARLGLAPGQATKDCPNPLFQSNAPQVTGNAILSRFPIRRVSKIKLPQCHDWFLEQRDGPPGLEERQTRRGSRMALVAQIDLPGGADSDLTVVSAHLENKSWPSCRQGQLEFLLKELSKIKGPMVVGGDFNTWGTRYIEKDLFASAVRAGFSWEANDDQPTFSMAGLPVRLDYFLFRKNDGLHKIWAKTLSAVNSPVVLSDHHPIYSRFQLIPK
ncbi:MAG: endonuclease/exonuclease/phosphatase family protein [Bdellovibrionales bacterium]|nr:endonuclease/exonuclease/phosphatase family protein [Bdellovibrionales bacterium]